MADILPVTSNQEFFGASVMEAIYCGTKPILPNSLAYPELIPPEHHLDVLYKNENELYEKVFVNPIKKIGSIFWKRGDVGIIDKFGPDGISKLVKIISNKTGRLQTGFIYDYAFVMLLGLSILLTYLILK